LFGLLFGIEPELRDKILGYSDFVADYIAHHDYNSTRVVFAFFCQRTPSEKYAVWTCEASALAGLIDLILRPQGISDKLRIKGHAPGSDLSTSGK
jgi:hypothetical protein